MKDKLIPNKGSTSFRHQFLAMIAMLTMTISFSLHSQTMTSTMEHEQQDLNQYPNILYWGQWNTGIGANSYADLVDSEVSAQARLNVRSGAVLTNWLNLNSNISLVGRSGFSQNRFGTDSMGSGININEALVTTHYHDNLILDAGIIDQGFIGSPLLVSSRPFPGLRQSAKIGSRRFSAQLTAQQAVPTSRSLDSRRRSEKESTPLFFTQSLSTSYHPNSMQGITLSATRFEFQNLATIVADESRALGNTVPHSSAAQSQFLFDYKGMLYSLRAKTPLTTFFHLDGQLQLLENSSAPRGLNRGFSAELAASYHFSNHKLRASFMNFFNEADSSPAYYNSSALGHNNIKGNSYALSFHYGRLFAVNVRYTQSDVIRPNLVNTARENIQFSLETFYIDF